MNIQSNNVPLGAGDDQGKPIRNYEMHTKVCVYNRGAFCDEQMASLQLPSEVQKIPIQGLYTEMENRIINEFKGNNEALVKGVSQRLKYLSTLKYSNLSVEELAYTNFLIGEYIIALFDHSQTSRTSPSFNKYMAAKTILEKSIHAMRRVQDTDRAHEDEDYFIGKTNVAKFFVNTKMLKASSIKSRVRKTHKTNEISMQNYIGIAFESLEHTQITMDHLRLYFYNGFSTGILMVILEEIVRPCNKLVGFNIIKTLIGVDSKKWDNWDQYIRMASEIKRRRAFTPAAVNELCFCSAIGNHNMPLLHTLIELLEVLMNK